MRPRLWSCPSWVRTRTLLIQSQACCQLHQGAPVLEPTAGRGPASCAGRSGRRGSNPRPSAWEADALPTELLPQANRGVPKYTATGSAEPPVGLEPTTARLRIECSTTELRWRPGPPFQSGPANRHGAEGTRTPDLLGAIQALSQLSYSPVPRPHRDRVALPVRAGAAWPASRRSSNRPAARLAWAREDSNL